MLASCYLYDIVEPNPDLINPEVWERVRLKMDETSWLGQKGKRIGFVSTGSKNGLIGGYFANEGERRGYQYSDDKKPIDARNDNFEHLFFAIYTDTSQLLLQHRNIYGYKELGMPLMRDNFLKILGELLRIIGIGLIGDRVKTESAGEMFTQEELLTFFQENSVFKIEVKDLAVERVPAMGDRNYKLFNPKEEWNEITWTAVADTLKVGARNVFIEASQDDDTAQLNKGPLTKAFATIGEIEEVGARNNQGYITIRRKSQDEEIQIDLPAEPSTVSIVSSTK